MHLIKHLSCKMVQIIFLLLLSTVGSRVHGLSLSVNADGTNSHECFLDYTPCKTLEYISKNLEAKEDVYISLDSRDLDTSGVALFDGWTNLTIQGQGATINCTVGEHGSTSNELYFKNSQGISLHNLTIIHCSIENSFSNIKGNEFKFCSGLIIKNTSYVLINHVVVTKSDGYGAALINNYKEINVTNSQFTWNILSESHIDHIIGGSGMIILVSKCDIEKESICTNSTLTDYTHYEISFVAFQYNNHNKPTKVLNWMLLYGGGLNILLNSKIISQVIKITSSNFSENIVTAGGGGLGLTLCERATGNQVLIEDCNFSGNFAKVSDPGGGGGGLKLGLFTRKDEIPGYNNITFNRCNFIGNKAIYGGGAAIKIGGTATNFKNKSILLFKNSSWYYNEGIFSAAMDISQQVQQLMATTFCSIPEFESCQFTGNLIFDKAKPINISLYQGKATFLITRVQVQFKGNTSFLGNDQTGLSIVSANVYVKDSSSMKFIHNHGNEVGGISIAGFSIIQYEDNVIFNFINNHGRLPFGTGAIYAKSYDPHVFISSHMCFLQSVNRNANNITFYFFSNETSIFVTGLHPCRYACTNNEDTVLPPISNPFNNNANNCLGQFHFNNTSTNKAVINVTTETSNANLTVNKLYVVPGRTVQVPVMFLDDLNQTVTSDTVYFPKLYSLEIKIGIIDTSSIIVGNNLLTLNGHPGLKGNLTLEVLGLRDYTIMLQYEILPCPTGYVIDSWKKSSKCNCSATMGSDQWYNGVLGCNETDMSIFILPDFWLGYTGNNENISDIENQLYTGQCPPGYCNMTLKLKGFLNGQFYQLKSKANRDTLSSIMCNRGREGKLCGKCRNGTSPYLHSDYFACQAESKQCDYGLLFYVLSELFPLSILFIVVVYYNISFTSGAAYSIVFFIQQLHIMEMSIHGILQFQNNIFIQVANFFYSMLNFQFFDADIFSFCLWRGATTMDILSMRLISIGYALCLLILLVLIANKCGRCSRYCKRNNSMVHGLTAFLIMCYSEVTHVSFNLLNYETLKGKGGREYPYKIVFINGEMEYFSKDHLFYAIPAIIVVAFIIIPTPLCLLCDPIFLKIEDHLKVFEHCKPWTRLREPFKPLMDSFQSCFKDKFRFYAGLFFLYRTAILANLFIFSDNMQYHFVNEMILMIIFGIQAVSQPFQETRHNVLASVTLLALLSINALGMRINMVAGNKHYTSEVTILQCFQLILVYFPLLIGLLWIIKLLYRKCQDWKKRSVNAVNDNNDVEVSLIFDRDVSVEQYGTINEVRNRCGRK